MERGKLQLLLSQKISNNEKHHTMDEVNTTMHDLHEYYMNKNPHEDIILCVEEMAELTQVLSKIKRGNVQTDDISLYEEVADVLFCLYEITHFVFYVPSNIPDMDEKIKLIVDHDKSMLNNRDIIILTMSRLANLSRNLIHYIGEDINNLSYNLIDTIIMTNASVISLINEYSLDMEKINYIKDIKLERTQERIKNNIL